MRPISAGVTPPPALPLQQRLKSFNWLPSPDELAARRQLEAFYDTVLGPGEQALPASRRGGAGAQGEAAREKRLPPQRARSHELHELVPLSSSAAVPRLPPVVESDRRLSTTPTCAFQDSASGSHTVPGNCFQTKTVTVGGNGMQIEGTSAAAILGDVAARGATLMWMGVGGR